jgi:hypothetical protein
LFTYKFTIILSVRPSTAVVANPLVLVSTGVVLLVFQPIGEASEENNKVSDEPSHFETVK